MIAPGDARWRQMLQRNRHDFYHLPEYLELAGRYEEGTAVAFYAEEGDRALLIPLLIRQVPGGNGQRDLLHDLSSPYGYPCPLLSEGGNVASASKLFRAFLQYGRDAGLVSAFIRLHPLLNFPMADLGPDVCWVREGETVSIDLTASLESLQRQTRENHRRGIRKLKKQGFQVVMDDWNRYGEFCDIYAQTMDRLGADSFYLFPPQYFAEFRQAMGDRLHLCTVLSPDGELAAAGIFTLTCGIIQYHLGGTSETFLKMAPSKLMFDEARRWGKSQGARWLHLGGGLGSRQDSLFLFKAGFSRGTAPFYTCRVVFDPPRYQGLAREMHPVESQPREGFFPAYRWQGQ